MDERQRTFRDMIAAGIWNRNRGMGRQQAQPGAIPNQQGAAPGMGFTVRPTEMITARGQTAEEQNADTARMMMDRRFGSNDPMNQYYIGRWDPNDPYNAKRQRDAEYAASRGAYKSSPQPIVPGSRAAQNSPATGNGTPKLSDMLNKALEKPKINTWGWEF